MKKIELHDVVVLPQTKIEGLHKGLNSFSFGSLVTDKNLDFVHHHRSSRLVINIDEMKNKIGQANQYLNGQYFYCGAIDYHFGHFISECLGRLYAWEDSGSLKPLWCPTWRSDDGFGWLENLPTWQTQILSYCGLDFLNVLYVTNPTIIESLTIAESGAVLYSEPKPEMLDWLDKRQILFESTSSKSSSGSKIFVSRGRFGGNLPKHLSKRINGIEVIESRFKACGYTIFYPEMMSIREQLKVYAGAQKIVFENGSAIHLLELFRRIDADIAIIPRDQRVGLAFEKVLMPRVTGQIWTYPGKIQSDSTVVSINDLLQYLYEADFIN